MYRCEKCDAVVGPNQKMNRVVVETRPKSYAVFKNVASRRKDDGNVREHVGNASGHEIAREIVTCSSCARAMREDASGLAVAAAAV